MVKLRNGKEFVLDHYLDLLTIKEIYLDNDYGLDLEDAEVILDIGANFGTFTVLASELCPEAIIYGYEPLKKNFLHLKKNIEMNNIDNASLFKLAVGKERGQTSLFYQRAGGLSSLIDSYSSKFKEEVEVISLEEIFESNNIKHCDFVEIDCEGSEVEIILNSPAGIFEKIDAFSIEYHDNLNNQSSSKISQHLEEHGYEVGLNKHELEDDIGIIYARK